MRNNFLGAVFGVLTVGMLAACGGGGDAGADAEDAATPPAATPTPPPATTPPAAADLPEGVTQEMVAQGQAIFTGAGLCATCHGPDGSGTALAPNLHDDEWLNISGRNYDEIVDNIMTGVAEPKEHPAPMPPRGGSQITDEQVRQVAAYVYSLGGS